MLTLRDLFQVVFEMKKKESEDEKKLKLDREPAKTEQKPTVRHWFIISRRALAREGDYEMMPVCACVRLCVRACIS